MNKPSGQYAANDAAKSADPARKSEPGNSAPTFTKVERIQDPRETAQEAVHQVTPRDIIKQPANAGDPLPANGNEPAASPPEKQS